MQLSSALVERAFARAGLTLGTASAFESETLALRIAFDPAGEAIVCQIERGRVSASIRLEPLTGLHAWQARHLASRVDLPTVVWDQFSAIALGLYNCFTQCDALDCVIAPLMLADDRITVGGGAITLDDSALFRQVGLLDAPVERVGLLVNRHPDGVTIIANGAGLLMAGGDALAGHGIVTGTLIEMTAPLTAALLREAAGHLIGAEQPVLVNLFCDGESALDLIPALTPLSPAGNPLIVRLAGKDAGHAVEHLRDAGIPAALTLSDAVTLLARALSATVETA